MTSVVRPALGHLSSPEPPMSLVTLSLIWDLPPSPGSGDRTTCRQTSSILEAFQVAKDLMSLLILPTSQGPWLAKATRDRRGQGALHCLINHRGTVQGLTLYGPVTVVSVPLPVPSSPAPPGGGKQYCTTVVSKERILFGVQSGILCST